MTSILSDDLGAAEDRDERPLRLGERLAEILELLLHQEAGDGRRSRLGDALGRRVRAVRGAERVVDVDVGECRELLSRSAGSFVSSSSWKRTFSSTHGDCGREPCACSMAFRAGSPTQSVAKLTAWSSSRARCAATGSSENSGLGPPLGRPR